MIEKCFAVFKRGRTNTDDAERSGRPNSVVIPENIKKANKMVLSDRKLKLRGVADTLKISEGSVFTILHEHLSMRRLCSKRILRLFAVDQTQQRVDDSELAGPVERTDREYSNRSLTVLWPRIIIDNIDKKNI